MTRILFLAMLCLLIEGCASLSLNVSGLTKTSIDADKLIVHELISRDFYIRQADCVVDKLDRKMLTQKLGNASSIIESDRFEVIRYKVPGYRWVGIVPQIILSPVGFPLPIMLPIGSNHVDFNFDKNTNELINAEIYSHEVKFSTGLFFGQVNEGGVNPFYGGWFGSIPFGVDGWVGWDGYKAGTGISQNCIGSRNKIEMQH